MLDDLGIWSQRLKVSCSANLIIVRDSAGDAVSNEPVLDDMQTCIPGHEPIGPPSPNDESSRTCQQLCIDKLMPVSHKSVPQAPEQTVGRWLSKGWGLFGRIEATFEAQFTPAIVIRPGR